MGKRSWKAGNFVYPLPAVMVSVGDINDKDSHNIITIGWTGTINTNPPKTYISVRKERHSYDTLMKTGEFVINLTTEDLCRATDFCGVKSGRDYNKFEYCNLTTEASENISAPRIKESPVCIECRVYETQDLGSHTMFLADVLSISVDEKYFDDNDKFHLEDANPICYFHGAYYSVGKQLGTFGYSIMKDKTKKKRKLDDKKNYNKSKLKHNNNKTNNKTNNKIKQKNNKHKQEV